MIPHHLLPFAILGLILIGIALFQRYNFLFALIGFVVLSLLTSYTNGLAQYLHIMTHQIGIAANILMLFIGFHWMTHYLEDSHLLSWLCMHLPSGVRGHLLLLLFAFLLSIVIDNIAAVLIAGAIAEYRFHKKLHVCFIAALIVCANAGGAGSIIGDTTTTLLWLSGITQLQLSPAFIGAIITMIIIAIPASLLQERYQTDIRQEIQAAHPPIQWTLLCVLILNLALPVCITIYCSRTHCLDTHMVPIFGIVLLGGLCTTRMWRPLQRTPETHKISLEACFVILLILIAAMMPINSLPMPTITSTYGIGLLSAFFDNIPLTALAIQQQHYHWALLAFAVGVGGSLLWFGSSAGVALTAQYPYARIFSHWWRTIPLIAISYTIGFASIAGWSASPRMKTSLSCPSKPSLVTAPNKNQQPSPAH